MTKGNFWLVPLLTIVLISTAALTAADEPPPTRAEVTALIDQQPLDKKSWPSWRDHYIRLYYAYETGEPIEFYDRIYAFIGAEAKQNQGELPSPYAEDLISWLILSRYYLRIEHDNTKAEAAARKALSLGDPSGLSSSNLASVLLSTVRPRQSDPLTPEDRVKLDEAEQRLQLLERTVPQSRPSFYYGLLAWKRGDLKAAIPLLKQGALDYPHQPSIAANYLSACLSNRDSPKAFAAATESCVEMFPNDPLILAFHAMALYGDEQYTEAYEALQKGRRLDESAVAAIGDELIKAIEEARWITPLVHEGINLQKQNLFGSAAGKFRKALQEQPDNIVAARLLAGSSVADAHNQADAHRAASECSSLCRQFPKDAELHVIRGISLARIGHSMHANEALLEAKELGGDLNKLVGAANLRKIREDAQQQEQSRTITLGVLYSVAGLLGWIAVMFAVGVLLASAVPRQPDPMTISEEVLSPRERWLERAYLLVLTLGLIIFYLTLPIVCLGLLAITLGLFFLLLALRVLHIGILYRGLYAVGGVFRSATIGPSHDVLGIEVRQEQYPRLFEIFTEVADRLKTRPVDSVYLTPTAEISVHDRGHGPFGLFRKSRVMQIGMPTFSNLTVSEFKSVLAHEFAHFSHQHTFYSRFIFQVSAPLSHSLAIMNAAGGAMNYLNPFYGFYWLYLKAFELLAAGFSRSHEFLADRRAAYAYGKDVFRSSFTKIIVEGRMFQGTMVNSVSQGLRMGRVYINLFEAFRLEQDQPEGQQCRHRLFEELMAEKPGWYTSHPTCSERLNAIEAVPNEPHPVDLTPSTNLLNDVEAIETQLTDLLTRHIRDMTEMMDVYNSQEA